MNIIMKNNTGQNILLSIDNGNQFALQPYETKIMNQNISSSIYMMLGRSDESYVSKRKMRQREYHMIIESDYLISGVSDGEIFQITREKINLDLNVFYDRLFLCPTNSIIKTENHKVLTEDKLKKAFNKAWYKERIIKEPFESFAIIYILIPIAGIVIAFLWGWKLLIIFLLISYLLLITTSWLGSIFVEWIFKKSFRSKNDKKIFYNFFDNNFIKSYYARTERTPYMGSVET